jgi:hypothetical protein
MGHRALLRRLGLLGVLSLALAGVLRADDQPAGKSSSLEPAEPENSSPHRSF